MDRKKVVICSSMSFWKEINKWKEKLENDKYQVIKFPKQFTGEFLPNYKIEFSEHYQKIAEADILFVLNVEKDGKKGYIGASVFAEIAFAIGLNRALNKNIKIYCLNNFTDSLPYYEELKYWEQLGWLNYWEK